ncbi:MAG: HAD-IA family hydrolase [Porphyromonadaceae bacterium]|nr:HAD-IA family hydrolase [Porphyromonadaceae bacterium]
MNEITSAYLQKTGFSHLDPKAVLIDMDGVLYNSMPYHAEAWYKAVSSQGIACTLEEFFLYEGRTGASTIDLIFNRAYGRDATEEEKKQIYTRKCEFFERKGAAAVMPGSFDFLQQVKSLGLLPVLVTGSGQRTLLSKLSHDFPGIFTPQTMVTSFDVKYGKPHPEPYLIGLQKASVQPWQAIVVENAPLGVQAGVAAHIFTVAVNTGPLPNHMLIEAGADYLLPDMLSLSAHFEELYTLLTH